jgi:hypothetical protein
MNTLNAVCLQGNETSLLGRDPWELLDAKADIAFLAIELVDTRQSAPRIADAAAAQHSAAAAAAVAADEEGGVSVQQQADVSARAGPPTRLKLRWNNTNNVEIVMLQGDNNQEASSILPHVNTPGILHCYIITLLRDSSQTHNCILHVAAPAGSEVALLCALFWIFAGTYVHVQGLTC